MLDNGLFFQTNFCQKLIGSCEREGGGWYQSILLKVAVEALIYVETGADQCRQTSDTCSCTHSIPDIDTTRHKAFSNLEKGKWLQAQNVKKKIFIFHFIRCLKNAVKQMTKSLQANELNGNSWKLAFKVSKMICFSASRWFLLLWSTNSWVVQGSLSLQA